MNTRKVNNMENTVENKSKFITRYWGQEVARLQNSPTIPREVSAELIKLLEFGRIIFLELTPLSQITDEDAKEAVKFSGINDDGHYDELFRNLVNSKYFGEYFLKHRPMFMTESSMVIDFLRSKGYALPWMGLSVEQLVEYGWVKLNN